MLKNIFSFLNSELPHTILLDTNFILNLTSHLTGHNSRYLNDCKTFAERLVKNGSEFYITDWVLQEVLFQIIEIKLKEEIAKNNLKVTPMELYKDSPGIINKIYPLLNEVHKQLVTLTHNRKLEESSFAITEKALSIIRSKQMLPTDAYIIATACVNKNIEAVVTCDYNDFRRVADLIRIYVPDEFLHPLPKR